MIIVVWYSKVYGVSTDMNPDTEASLTFLHDGLYGQFNSAVLLQPCLFCQHLYFLLSLLTRGVKMELVINILVKGHYND